MNGAENFEGLFAKLHTPIEPVSAETRLSDEPVYRLLGVLCIVYGGFILLMTLIPNPPIGRACFVFVGGVIGGAGFALHAVARRKQRELHATETAAGVAPPPRPAPTP